MVRNFTDLSVDIEMEPPEISRWLTSNITE